MPQALFERAGGAKKIQNDAFGILNEIRLDTKAVSHCTSWTLLSWNLSDRVSQEAALFWRFWTFDSFTLPVRATLEAPSRKRSLVTGLVKKILAERHHDAPCQQAAAHAIGAQDHPEINLFNPFQSILISAPIVVGRALILKAS